MQPKDELHYEYFHARQNPLTNSWLCTDDRLKKSFAFYTPTKRDVKGIIASLKKKDKKNGIEHYKSEQWFLDYMKD